MIHGAFETPGRRGKLGATLGMPKKPCGIAVFAHGSGSGRFSPRNEFVASKLRECGFATLLIDLLTEDEDRIDRESGRFRFDIPLLAERLLAATAYVRCAFADTPLPVGYFGASTGVAAALVAASRPGNSVFAVVSRGGRPDLAGDALAHVRAPVLLIVGSLDKAVLELNRKARPRMRCRTQLAIVPGASHLFEEPGALARVADLAAAWFSQTIKGGMSVA